MTALVHPIKRHGGKAYLASRIVALMPPRLSSENPEGWCHYVEPFAGGLSVLLANDPAGISEVVNDLDRDLTDFWRVMQCPTLFEQFRRAVEATPFSEWEWDQAVRQLDADPGRQMNAVARSLCWFVVARQSLAGRCKAFAPLSRTRVRRGMNEQASAWIGAVEGLPAVHERLRRVVILNRDALDVIRGQDGERTLFYCDPPYLHETRATTDDYAHEMSIEQHRELLQVLRDCDGDVLLSGYRSMLYDDMLASWTRHDWGLPNNAAGGGSKRRMVECVWCNW